MNTRRYVARSMREALERVRAEQGPDAVIVGTGRGPGGVEVVVALDYDPAAAVATAAAPPPRMVWSQDEPVLALRRELGELRALLEQQLARLSGAGLAPPGPFPAQVLQELCALDLAPDLALRLVEEMPAMARPENPAGVALALLLRRLPALDAEPLAGGGAWALVGPTGAGKTTTIAKLATHHIQAGQAGAPAIIALDRFQVGAGERLAGHARRLGARLRLVASPAELATALDGAGSARLALVDTAGFAPRDPRFAGQAAVLAGAAPRLRTLLVLPANADAATLAAVIRAHAPLRPAGCILTKIDETASLGPALSALLRSGLPLAYLSAGQQVPQDLHAAAGRRVWLVRLAVKLRAAAAARAATGAAALAGEAAADRVHAHG